MVTPLHVTWDIFVLCGYPSNAADDARFAGFDWSALDSISSPGNLAIDDNGNL